MCGRFTNNNTTGGLLEMFTATAGPDAASWLPSFSVAPTNRAPIVREYETSAENAVVRQVDLATWNVPQPPGQPSRGPIINARFEKLTDRFWVGAFSNSRVLVPMDGYYEWTGPAGDKTPHYLHGDGPLVAAGLARFTRAEPDGPWATTFAIVTRAARDASGEIHDRMPAFLTPDLWAMWLNPESLTAKKPADSKANREGMLEVLDRSSADVAQSIRAHVVDRKVNSVRTLDRHDPTLVVAVG